MNNTDRLRETLARTILEFTSDLRRVFTAPLDQGDILLIEFAFKKMDNKSIMDHAVNYILPHKEKITTRDISFFDKNKDKIFAGLPSDKTTHFAKLLTTMNHSDLSVIWQYFDVIIELTESYKKLN